MSVYIISLLAYIYAAVPAGHSQALQQTDACNVFGVIYIEPVKARADYVVYEEKTEAFADLRVFKEDNKLLADDAGLWYFTDKRDFADFTIYIQKEPSNADFTIYYTDVVSYAGCD